MGISNSKIEEDKALQLCRERKKFIRHALDGRCSLAATHVTYIQSLRFTGTSLRKFVEPEVATESSLYTSTNCTPEPPALTEKSLSQFSFSSPSVSQRVDAAAYHLSPSPPPSSSSTFHVSHMRFRGGFSKKVEEKPPEVVTGTITSSSTPRTVTPRAAERPEIPPPSPPMPDDDSSPHPLDSTPWDYFGLFNPIENHITSDQQSQTSQRFENDDAFKHMGEDEGMPELEENQLDNNSSHGRGEEESQDSEDEFDDDDPSPVTLVRSFENPNRLRSLDASASPTMLTADSATPEHEVLTAEKSNSPEVSPFRGKASEQNSNSPDFTSFRGKASEQNSNSPEVTPFRGKASDQNSNSPEVSPFRGKASGEKVHTNAKKTAFIEEDVKSQAKDDGIEHKVAPKDFFVCMRDIEYYFVKASDSGREVPRMLEANKFHFRPIVTGKENASITVTLFKVCFSCGKDPSQEQEEPAQTSVKYLTWHRTMSSHSSSSRNPLGGINTRDDIDDLNSNLFENICMISGSHASTLDRLYAWERKLYDEVKASQIVRRKYDLKCKFLREQESKAESSQRVDKTRALVKDLHSRIRVSIQRIDTISQRIEELRDKELQPQLEELIEGLRRMWEVMTECHKIQLHIITIAYTNTSLKIPVGSELHRHATTHLQDQLHALGSSFTKWVSAQKFYVRAINDWLHKCVTLPQQQSTNKRRRARPQTSILRRSGPPIYTTCGLWLELLETLPVKEVGDTLKGLTVEISRFLPRSGGGGNIKAGMSEESGGGGAAALDTFEDWNTGYDQFRSSLVIFLKQLSNFAESSVKMYGDLQKAIQASKKNYEQLMAQPP